MDQQAQLRERVVAMKRKHEDEKAEEFPAKKQKPVVALRELSPSPLTTTAGELKFPNGALRITRTPGRSVGENTIRLDDLIDSSALTSAFVFAFFIAQDQFFKHFPFKRPGDDTYWREEVPIWVGRDVNQDPYLHELALSTRGLTPGTKLAKDQFNTVREPLVEMYSKKYGRNYKAVYPVCTGCAHSKVLALLYPTFLRIVITSANMMDSDTVIGDNHFYIHDLPLLASTNKTSTTEFESDFLEHLELLACPAQFITQVRSQYDFSSVKVSLVVSNQGAHSGLSAEKYGLLRLRALISRLEISAVSTLEYCAGSIGKLNAVWLNQFHNAATGGRADLDEDADLLPLTVVFPTPSDVKRCWPDSQEAGANVGCHLRPWPTSPADIKGLFHHYKSKDDKRLFHMKLLMAFGNDPTGMPLYVYIGSHNLSKGAWGSIATNKSGVRRIVGISNIECGVVIPGSLILDLIEAGNDSWENAIVPYVRPAEPYKPNEKAWNDPRWVRGG